VSADYEFSISYAQHLHVLHNNLPHESIVHPTGVILVEGISEMTYRLFNIMSTFTCISLEDLSNRFVIHIRNTIVMCQNLGVFVVKTTLERLSANTRHVIADCGGCKAIATNECITANTRIICRRGEA
jgi:hypothetical protein